jgi:hypothetical protein
MKIGTLWRFATVLKQAAKAKITPSGRSMQCDSAPTISPWPISPEVEASHYGKRSEGLHCSARPIRKTISNEGFRTPCSSWLMYVRCKPQRLENSSWVNSSSVRRRFTCMPNCRMSAGFFIRKICFLIRYESMADKVHWFIFYTSVKRVHRHSAEKLQNSLFERRLDRYLKQLGIVSKT